jgi:hypothetical protein
MAYIGELGVGSSIYIDNQDHQTIVTTVASAPGQQQQMSHSLPTGRWTTSPELFHTPQGLVIKLETTQGDRYLHIQSHQVRLVTAEPSPQTLEVIPLQQVAQPPTLSVPPLPPPLHPQDLGTLFMSLPPLQMPLEHLPMGKGITSTATHSLFHHSCSQCGTTVTATDKFCAHCGHRLP